ncbi:UNVERIFIED_CONTAM: hypothetical protein ABID98_001956 [Brevibacillus sp. OAP136]
MKTAWRTAYARLFFFLQECTSFARNHGHRVGKLRISICHLRIVVINKVKTVNEAIQLVNDSRYGLKKSGTCRDGIKYTVEEMTEMKLIYIPQKIAGINPSPMYLKPDFLQHFLLTEARGAKCQRLY